MSSKLRIIVLGYVVRGPLAGMVWSNMQYLLGLARLGHDVYFVEDSDDFAGCYDPKRNVIDVDPTYGLKFAGNAFREIGFSERWAYYDAHTLQWIGPAAREIVLICEGADVVINLCGVNPLRPWLMNIPVRVLVDEDPAFTQIRHLTEKESRKRALAHNAFFSFGENIGNPSCAIPDDGIPWKPTRQPVVLNSIPVTPGPVQGKFTTVMQWQSYPPREYQGVRYGMKSDSFLPYMQLPQRTNTILELAVTNSSTPLAEIRENGWHLREALEISTRHSDYHQYVEQSKAEFSVAKHGYVVSRSGWFSERSAYYLATGRPVLIQETGFSDWLKRDGGLIPFKNPEEALVGIDEINSRYSYHSQMARQVAEIYFDSNKILSNLIDDSLSFDETSSSKARIRSGV